MMWRHLLMSAVMLVVVSCSSNYPLLSNKGMAEIESLKGYCKEQEINTDDTRVADSLSQAAVAMKKEGNDIEAFWASELAAARYQLAIAHNQLAKSKENVAGLEKSLQDAQQQLKTYQQVLNELQNMEAK